MSEQRQKLHRVSQNALLLWITLPTIWKCEASSLVTQTYNSNYLGGWDKAYLGYRMDKWLAWATPWESVMKFKARKHKPLAWRLAVGFVSHHPTLLAWVFSEELSWWPTEPQGSAHLLLSPQLCWGNRHATATGNPCTAGGLGIWTKVVTLHSQHFYPWAVPVLYFLDSYPL